MSNYVMVKIPCIDKTTTPIADICSRVKYVPSPASICLDLLIAYHNGQCFVSVKVARLFRGRRTFSSRGLELQTIDESALVSMELDPLSDSIYLQVISEDSYKKLRWSQLSTMLIH